MLAFGLVVLLLLAITSTTAFDLVGKAKKRPPSGKPSPPSPASAPSPAKPKVQAKRAPRAAKAGQNARKSAPGTAGSSAAGKAGGSSAELVVEVSYDGGKSWKPRQIISHGTRRAAGRVSKDVVELTDHDVIAFNALVKADARYLVRVGKAMVAIPACSLASSRFRERLAVHLDDDGDVVALSYILRNPVCEPGKVRLAKAISLKSEVVFDSGKLATHAAVPSVQELQAAAEAEASVDNRPWFLRYWYYILPVVLLLMLPGGS